MIACRGRATVRTVVHDSPDPLRSAICVLPVILAHRSWILYDGPMNLSSARVIVALRAFATAVKQMAEGYAQGPPGC